MKFKVALEGSEQMEKPHPKARYNMGDWEWSIELNTLEEFVAFCKRHHAVCVGVFGDEIQLGLEFQHD